MQVAPSGGHASSATWWPKVEPIQVALQFGTNATGILLAGEITQVKETIPRVRCASGNVLLVPRVVDFDVQYPLQGPPAFRALCSQSSRVLQRDCSLLFEP